MAVIKAVSSKAGIGQALDYVTKEEKTEDKLVSGLHCEPDTEALIREARAGINSSRTREENSGADRANSEAERSRQRAEAQRRAEEAKREAEARQAQRRARSRSYGIER